MTVINGRASSLRAGRPPWCQLPSGGYVRMPNQGSRHDRHHHDFNELYCVSGGRAKILNDGEEHYVQAGDIVCIRAGAEHDILELYGDEDLELFWLYEPGPPGGTLGHLHAGPEAEAWHPVPAKPVPADFPA